MKFDLTQAYYHVKIHPNSRKYLRFIWRGKLLQFLVLPFGIHTAPWIFTTLGNAVTLHLRSLAVRISLYLDDGLVLAASQQLCHHQVQTIVLPLLKKLGLTINYKKSTLDPSQTFTFLGYHWNSLKMSCTLPEDRLLNIKYLVNLALHQHQSSIQLLLRVLGICSAARMAVPLARLRCRYLQKLLLLNYRTPQDIQRLLVLTPSARQELLWWSALPLQRCMTNFNRITLTSTILLSTDASDQGWSYLLAGLWKSGRWRPQHVNLHINHKEFLALQFALQQNVDLVQNRTVLWEVDNTTALAYVRNEGGTKDWPLCQKVIHLLLWCHPLNITIVPKYVPSQENIVADRGSRFLQVEDWFLLPRVTRRIFQLWGTPQVDLMATSQSNQVPAYFAFDRLDQFARGIDAFAQEWNFTLAYLFPPPPVILKCLNKIREAPPTSVFILILPWWPNKPWFPLALELALQPPYRLPVPHNLVVDLAQDKVIPDLKRLKLTAWKLSGRGHHTPMLNIGCNILSTKAGRKEQTDVINQHGIHGSNFVDRRAWTHLEPLFK